MKVYPRTLIGASLIFLIVKTASCVWLPDNPTKEEVCESEECKVRGNFYKANMDNNVHPCDDFYTFTCGNWRKNQPGPKYATERSILDVMASDFAKIVRDAITSYRIHPDSPVLFKGAKEVYEICVKIPEYPKSSPSDIAREINKVGRLPRTRLWDIHTKYLKLTGESALLQAAVIGESSQGTPVLLVMEPPSAYGSILHEDIWKPREKEAYTRFLFQAIKSLNLPGTDAQIKQRIEKVFDFRDKLNEVILRNEEMRPDRLNPLTAQQLDKWFADNIGDLVLTQDIPWVDVMGALYHKLPLQQRHNRNLIAIRQQMYFLELMELLQNVSPEVLAFHMEIHFIERNMKFDNNLLKLLEGTSVEPHGLLVYIRERFHPRWETCIDNHNMKKTLEKMVYAHWFKDKKDEVAMINQLVSATQTEIYNQMKNSHWLDSQTRVSTLTQFNGIVTWVGFPPWVTAKGPVTLTRDLKEILKPNASLNMARRVLYITAALLLPPIFDMKLPALYNYAGLGTTIGHELHHVINDCGTFLKDNVSVVWWAEKIRDKCYERLHTFIRTFKKITNREYQKRYGETVKANTMRTVLEDYPDVMGLDSAYNVYQDVVKTRKSICKTLPNFEDYSCDQMFFIAFANTYCGHLSKKSAMNKLKTGDHSIDSVRINGAVSQIYSFAAAFRCPIESPMNPLEKLYLWE